MLIEDVKKLSPVERFVYWVGERNRIYERRQAGQARPWTDDSILQTNYFTNVYRELDRTTQWFKEHIREPRRESKSVIFATVCFRWFNLIETGEVLIERGFLDNWCEADVVACLGQRRDAGRQIFTGAYMINSPPKIRKLEAIARRISNVWEDRAALCASASTWTSLKQAHERLTAYDGMGGFMAYEVVCDLRHTAVLERADDVSSWANPGPGAVRGLYRVLGWEIPNKSNATAPPAPDDFQEQVASLLATLRERYPDAPFAFEAREVEQSLCEFDKYDRLLFGDGKSKRSYDGVGVSQKQKEQNLCLW